jgi:hypothetical protein
LQIHLSTAIVMMFAAGPLIWANVRNYTSASVRSFYGQDLELGWPFKFYIGAGGNDLVESAYLIITDALVAMVFVLSIAVVWEWLNRGRAARKGD